MAGCLNPAIAAAPVDAPAATVTIQQGEATLIRAALKHPLAEGNLLLQNDIIESAADSRIVRLEADGGAAVDLGPSTRVMLLGRRPAPVQQRALALYVLRGWVKWAAGPAPSATDRLSAAGVEIDDITGSMVLRILPEPGVGEPSATVFAESGQARFQTRAGGPPTDILLQRGEFLVAGAGAPTPKLLSRPNPDFNQFAKSLPPTFADTLPRRLVSWQGRKVELRPGEPVSYADVSDWLHADRSEPGVRPTFPARWKSRLQDPAFRRPMMAEVALHPEWRPLLFVEAPRPRLPSPVVSPAGAPASVPLPAALGR